MKTSEFIAALAADPVPEPIRLGRRIVAALAIGFLGSLAIYGLLMGPRPDIAAAVHDDALLAEVRRRLSRSPCRRFC